MRWTNVRDPYRIDTSILSANGSNMEPKRDDWDGNLLAITPSSCVMDLSQPIDAYRYNDIQDQ
jgi:hypothetical protein